MSSFNPCLLSIHVSKGLQFKKNVRGDLSFVLKPFFYATSIFSDITNNTVFALTSCSTFLVEIATIYRGELRFFYLNQHHHRCQQKQQLCVYTQRCGTNLHKNIVMIMIFRRQGRLHHLIVMISNNITTTGTFVNLTVKNEDSSSV